MPSPASPPPIDIDRSAPSVALTAIHIDAPRDLVWAVLTDVGEWRTWFPTIDCAALIGALAVGSVIAWQVAGMSIRSRLTSVQPVARLCWRGTAGAMDGQPCWSLLTDRGGTWLRNEESVSGGRADHDTKAWTSELRVFLDAWNAALKVRCETLAAEAIAARDRRPISK